MHGPNAPPVLYRDLTARETEILVVLGAANDPLLSGKPWAVGPFESICEYDVCAEASTALYISEQGTSQPDVLKGALEAALGWAGQLRYPNGHPASEDGTQKDGTRP